MNWCSEHDVYFFDEGCGGCAADAVISAMPISAPTLLPPEPWELRLKEVSKKISSIPLPPEAFELGIKELIEATMPGLGVVHAPRGTGYEPEPDLIMRGADGSMVVVQFKYFL